MKNLILLAIVLSTINGFSQSQLDDYKFIVVPKKFNCFKAQNEHKTSTLIKYLFAKKGFEVYYQDQLSGELSAERCLGLLVDLNERSSLFNTKTSIVLRDCNTNVVFETLEGTSKEKDYESAYHEAIREAFVSIEALNYNYTPKKQVEEPITVSFKNDVKQIAKKETVILVEKVEEKVVELETPVEAPKNVDQEDVEVISDNTVTEVDKIDAPLEKQDDLLYAQEITNGYQLIDDEPKVRMKLFKTSKADYFLAKSGDINGVVFKQEGKWFFEYMVDDTPKKEELNIKF